MISPNISYREQQLELERERLRYMRCNTITDIMLISSIFMVIIGLAFYILYMITNNKEVILKIS
jgi:hypothetical protein